MNSTVDPQSLGETTERPGASASSDSGSDTIDDAASGAFDAIAVFSTDGRLERMNEAMRSLPMFVSAFSGTPHGTAPVLLPTGEAVTGDPRSFAIRFPAGAQVLTEGPSGRRSFHLTVSALSSPATATDTFGTVVLVRMTRPRPDTPTAPDHALRQALKDMRTPLTALVGFSDLLTEDLADAGDRLRTRAETIAQAASRLSEVLTMYGAGCRPSTHGGITTLDGVRLVRRLLDDLMTEDPGRTFVLEMSQPVVPIHADPDDITEALHAVLSDVLDCSGHEDRVHVRLSREDGATLIDVDSHGSDTASADPAAQGPWRAVTPEDSMVRAILAQRIARGYGGDMYLGETESGGRTLRIVVPD